MKRFGGAIGLWRLGVFLLAAGFWAYQFSRQDLAVFGWQFRFLTVWALSLSVLSAAFALRLSLRTDETPPETLFTVTAALNGVSAILFWRFFLADPGLTRTDTGTATWEMWYLHAIGPALQWFEALILSRGLRRVGPALGWMAVAVLSYVAWLELAVRPLNRIPGGIVETGLPYVFLNEMALPERSTFYAQGAAIGLTLALLFALAGRRAAVPAEGDAYA